MKTIQLTQGFVTLVDDADYTRLSQLQWRALIDRRRNKAYAVSRVKVAGRTLYMHREILGISDSKRKVDHRNGNGLDNQRENLRPCNTSQNTMNSSKRSDGLSSRYKGVCWHKRYRKFQADIKLSGKSKFLGMFIDELDAAFAYDAAAREHFGEFALCNFPCVSSAPAIHSDAGVMLA
jgi:hypothetical protein